MVDEKDVRIEKKGNVIDKTLSIFQRASSTLRNVLPQAATPDKVDKLNKEIPRLAGEVAKRLREVEKHRGDAAVIKETLADHNKFVRNSKRGRALALVSHILHDIRVAGVRLEIAGKKVEHVIEVAKVETDIINFLRNEISQSIAYATNLGDEETVKVLNELKLKLEGENNDGPMVELGYLLNVVMSLHNMERQHPDLDHFINYFKGYVVEIRRRDRELASKLIKSEDIVRLIRRQRVIAQLNLFGRVIYDESSAGADAKGWNLVRTAYKDPKGLGAEYSLLFRDEETKEFFKTFFKKHGEDKKALVPAVREYITKLTSEADVIKVEHEAVEELKHLLAGRMLDLIEEIKDEGIKIVSDEKKVIEHGQKKDLRVINSVERKRDVHLRKAALSLVAARDIEQSINTLKHEDTFHDNEMYYDQTLEVLGRIAKSEGEWSEEQVGTVGKGLSHMIDAAEKINPTRDKVYKEGVRLRNVLTTAIEELNGTLKDIRKEKEKVRVVSEKNGVVLPEGPVRTIEPERLERVRL